MDPINRTFSHDYSKFVLQNPDVLPVERPPPVKPFKLKAPKKSKKTKKDMGKQKKNDEKKENIT